MKMITAIVQPDRLEDVIYAAVGAGARGLTATEVHGFGQQYGHLGAGAGSAERMALVLPKLRIDIVVADETADSMVGAIAKSVHTGSIGDGKIWVSPVESVLRVRTGQRDREAV